MTQAHAILAGSILTVVRALASNYVKHESAEAGKYDQVALACCGGTDTAKAELVEQSRSAFVLQTCTDKGFAVEINAKGLVALTASAVAAISKVDADRFAAAKNLARATHDKGIKTALARQGKEQWPTTGGRTTAARAEAAPAPSVDVKVDVTGIPPSIVADVERLRDTILHFQTTAKLTKDDKAAIGKVAELAQSLLDTMNGKSNESK